MAVRRKMNKGRRRKKSSKPKSKVDKKLSMRISKLENSIETKYIDSASGGAITTAGQTFSFLQGMGQGDNYDQRIGNQITSKKLKFIYNIFDPSDTAVAPSQVRVMIYWDLQFNGNTYSELFTGTSPDADSLSSCVLDNRAGQITVSAFYNENTKQRYKILYDRVHNINHGSSAIGQVVHVNKTISLSNAKMIFADTTATAASVPSRALLLSYFYVTGAAQVPVMNFVSRYFFTDL